ncbi:MAG: hypothetical protein ACLUNO_11315 [Oscillospiraceae bacterium]
MIAMGDKLNFVVPTGNFGDILAGWYAKQMGLPVGKLVCASNANNVLTDFIRTGTYDKNRPFHTTASPSMDILVSSNLERLALFRSAAATRRSRATCSSCANRDGIQSLTRCSAKIQRDVCRRLLQRHPDAREDRSRVARPSLSDRHAHGRRLPRAR